MKAISSAFLRAVLSLILLVSLIVLVGIRKVCTLRLALPPSLVTQEMLDGFKDLYESRTGEQIRFDITEYGECTDIMNRIVDGHENFDLFCSSDFVAYSLLQRRMLLPLPRNEELFSSNITQRISPIVDEYLARFDTDSLGFLDYTIPNSWGTVGMLYNTKFIDKEMVGSWDILDNPIYKGKILMMDRAEDMCSPLLLKIHRDDILAGRMSSLEAMRSCSGEDLDKMAEYIADFSIRKKDWVYTSSDDLMLQDEGYIIITWSSNAMSMIASGKEKGIDLDYSIPAEGSTLWVDTWVLPKYSKNVRAAKMFIDYMCSDEVVVRLLEKGDVSSVNTPALLAAASDDSFAAADVSYFFGEACDTLKVNPLNFPDKSIVDNCEIEFNSVSNNHAFIRLWEDAKKQNTMKYPLLVILAVVLVLVGERMWISRSR